MKIIISSLIALSLFLNGCGKDDQKKKKNSSRSDDQVLTTADGEIDFDGNGNNPVAGQPTNTSGTGSGTASGGLQGVWEAAATDTNGTATRIDFNNNGELSWNSYQSSGFAPSQAITGQYQIQQNNKISIDLFNTSTQFGGGQNQFGVKKDAPQARQVRARCLGEFRIISQTRRLCISCNWGSTTRPSKVAQNAQQFLPSR